MKSVRTEVKWNKSVDFCSVWNINGGSTIWTYVSLWAENEDEEHCAWTGEKTSEKYVRSLSLAMSLNQQ